MFKKIFIKNFCDAAAKNDANNLALMDEKFHSEIIKRCGNNLMIDVMERLNMGLKDFRNNTFQLNKMSKILLDLTKKF